MGEKEICCCDAVRTGKEMLCEVFCAPLRSSLQNFFEAVHLTNDEARAFTARDV